MPAPETTRVVQIEPAPTPTLTASAPAAARVSTPSSVTTLPAVTSGNYSPVLGHGIAMAFVTPGLADGSEVEVDVRGSRLAGRLVPMPFVS